MMEPRTLGFVEESCNGQLVAGQRSSSIRRVCTDSRLAKPGDLFVAIRGDRFDGHDYLSDALGQGADWNEVGSGSGKEGDRYVVRVRPSAAQQFFRLRSE